MPSLLQQRELLRKEYECEKAEFRRITETMGIGRKVKRGECWFPVTAGRHYYDAMNRLAVELTRSTDTDIAHRFEYGRSVYFFGQDASGGLHYPGVTGTVTYADEARMVVTVNSEADISRIEGIARAGVTLGFDETTYRLMFEALDRVIAAPSGRLAELREIVHGSAPVTFAPPTAAVPSMPWLNTSQQAAVDRVLRARDVMIVHGPPGTGKTTTLVEAVSEVLRREPQVMVCAQSNTAVDWIAEQLADRGISVLRIGNPVRVTDRMLACTYERRFEAHPDYPTLWQVRRNIRRLYATPRGKRPGDFRNRIARLREHADRLEVEIRRDLFDGARVIASTLAGAGHQLLTGQHFHTLFIDEAAQALEAACWIALAHADRVVLAGDHCQLPPTVKSAEALRRGLGVTMMEHLARTRHEAVSLLTMQYRMSEPLMRFSSHWFYHDRLTASPAVRDRSLLEGLDAPLVWIDTAEMTDDEGDSLREAFVGATYGRINRGEARLTLRALADYARRVGRHRLIEERADIGIISPYKAQVEYLRTLLRRDDYLRPLLPAITVNTVDAFQGQERDIILVSMVRANDEGQIGFLADLRRMNVAITRARMKLILIGDSTTLGRHRFYRELYESCEREIAE